MARSTPADLARAQQYLKDCTAGGPPIDPSGLPCAGYTPSATHSGTALGHPNPDDVARQRAMVGEPDEDDS